MLKLKFVKINEPRMDPAGQRLGPDYTFKNLAIVDPTGTFVLCEVNATALKEALLGTPELKTVLGLEIKAVEPKKKEEVK